jgi:hypothetical protein
MGCSPHVKSIDHVRQEAIENPKKFPKIAYKMGHFDTYFIVLRKYPQKRRRRFLGELGFLDAPPWCILGKESGGKL